MPTEGNSSVCNQHDALKIYKYYLHFFYFNFGSFFEHSNSETTRGHTYTEETMLSGFKKIFLLSKNYVLECLDYNLLLIQ